MEQRTTDDTISESTSSLDNNDHIKSESPNLSNYSSDASYLETFIRAVGKEERVAERGKSRRQYVTYLDPAEKQKRRLMRNRVAAKECRKKKKMYIQDLEEKVNDLESDKAKLISEIDELNAKLVLGWLKQQSISQSSK